MIYYAIGIIVLIIFWLLNKNRMKETRPLTKIIIILGWPVVLVKVIYEVFKEIKGKLK